MAALVGNEYYKIRSKDGRDKKYNPISLLEIANEYFLWCIKNPLKEQVIQKIKVSRNEEKIVKVEVNKMRVLSIQGFCNYAEIVINTFKNYEDDKDFMTVTTRIRGIIENHQLEGASAGLLNSSIIARKLGLANKSETTIREQPLFGNGE